jgi:hypothetical protein
MFKLASAVRATFTTKAYEHEPSPIADALVHARADGDV